MELTQFNKSIKFGKFITNHNRHYEHIHKVLYVSAGVIKHITYHFESSPPISKLA